MTLFQEHSTVQCNLYKLFKGRSRLRLRFFFYQNIIMDEKILGNVHSIESCGTVDGPGIRFVVFMQGCPMRCLYCHNPDSWGVGETIGTKMSPLDIISRYEGVREFCKGGITVTGGEPLLQIDFVTELFRLAQEKKILTALDTSGITYNPNNDDYLKKLDELMTYTDLVMLDIKHIDSLKHKELTKEQQDEVISRTFHDSI